MDINDLPNGTVILLPAGQWSLVGTLKLTRQIKFRSFDLVVNAARRALENEPLDLVLRDEGDEDCSTTAAHVTDVPFAREDRRGIGDED